MYGTGSTYALEHANTNKSTILNNLEAWYERDNKFALYENLLSDTIWCNDKSLMSGTGVSTQTTDYGAMNRISTSYETGPSLVCPNDKLGGKLSKFTVDDTKDGNGNLKYKISLLTIDEIAFAGGVYNINNKKYYLYVKDSLLSWWVLSPNRFSSSAAHVWFVDYQGEIYHGAYNHVSYIRGLRPAVSLGSTTKISSGNGTSGNPYIVSNT